MSIPKTSNYIRPRSNHRTQVGAFCLMAAAVTVVGSLSGCGPAVSSQDASFFVSGGGSDARSTFIPTGSGWVPGSEIDISLAAEPQKNQVGELFMANARSIGKIKVDVNGMFGFNPGPFQYSVARSLCGTPPPWMSKPFFVARDNTNGLMKFWAVEAFNWFSFNPCQ